MNLKKFAAEHRVEIYYHRIVDRAGHVGYYVKDEDGKILFDVHGFHSAHAARNDWLESEVGVTQAKALMASWKTPKIKTKSSAEKRLEKENKKLLARNESMAEWIRDAGVRYDICTKTVLGEVCSNCSCSNLPF